jgi:hypothetical protein
VHLHGAGRQTGDFRHLLLDDARNLGAARPFAFTKWTRKSTMDRAARRVGLATVNATVTEPPGATRRGVIVGDVTAIFEAEP